jgi:hypothetical protein
MDGNDRTAKPHFFSLGKNFASTRSSAVVGRRFLGWPTLCFRASLM